RPAKAPLPILTEEEEEPQPQRRSRGWRPFKKPETPPRDPNFCFNHQDHPKTRTCADCGETFCDACIVTVGDQPLCAPCKNYRVRALHRPRNPSALAIIAAIVGLISCPVAFCVSLMSVAGPREGSPLVGAIISAGVSVVPLLAIILGL